MDQHDKDIKKIAGLFDWDDIGEYVQNLISKTNRGFELSKEEGEVIEETPQEVIDTALDVVVSEEPLDDIPRVKRVKKKKPKEESLTSEEKEQIIEKSPELTVLNTFFPEILDDNAFFKQAPAPEHVDASFTVFEYLKAFGYKSGMWVIGPEHKALLVPAGKQKDRCRPNIDGIPICDYLHLQDLIIDDLLSDAQSHAADKGYYPPRSLIAQTHPGCRCYVLCWAPERVGDIPDSAPGVPTFGNPEEKLHYKQQIFERLQNFPVDRFTFLNPLIYEATETSEGRVIDEYDLVHSEFEYGGEAILDDLYGRKRKASSGWKDYVLPVGLSDGFVYQHSMGFVRPIPPTYKGFQVTTDGEYSRVYLSDVNRYVYVPVNIVQPLTLQSVSREMRGKDYIKVDDTFGIALSTMPDGKVLCYLPELGNVVVVDSGEVYEVS